MKGTHYYIAYRGCVGETQSVAPYCEQAEGTHMYSCGADFRKGLVERNLAVILERVSLILRLLQLCG